MRTALLVLAGTALGFGVCYALLATRPKSMAEPLQLGSQISLTYPTGEMLTGGLSDGKETAVVKTVNLEVARIHSPGPTRFSGKTHPEFSPFTFTIGEVKYVCAPVSE